MSRVALALLALVAGLAQVHGYDEPPLKSYTRVTPDKKFVFVMLHQAREGERDPVAAKYAKSGLYLNNGSTDSIWVLDGDYVREAFPAADGVHVVLQHDRVITLHTRKCGNSPPEPPENPIVFSFYARGKKLRDVPLSEVLDNARFCQEHGPGWHPWLNSAQINDTAGTFDVVNRYDSTVRFELATGHQPGGPIDFCGNSESPRSSLWIMVGAGLALFSFLGLAVIAFVLFRSTSH